MTIRATLIALSSLVLTLGVPACSPGGTDTGPGTGGSPDADTGTADTGSTDTGDTGGGTATDATGDETTDTGTGLPPDCDVEPKLSSIVENYFDVSCNGVACHGSGAQGGLQLNDGLAYQQLVGVEAFRKDAAGKIRVVAGDPDASYLVHRLDGSGEGLLMPITETQPFDPECRIAAIKLWILNGAKDD